MKETFRAIQFDRKQRVAFIIILLLIVIGSVINIRGFSADRKKMTEVVNLDEVITQKYYYKKYYNSKYKKSYINGKRNNYSSSKGNRYKENNKKWNNESNIKSDSTFSYKVIDTLTQVNVPDDYTLEKLDTASKAEKQNKAFVLSSFDPNVATKDDLMLMYLPEKWINNLIAYRSKGGVYRKKEDLKKLYSTTDALYTEIESYVIMSDSAIVKLEEEQVLDKDAANQRWLEEVIASNNLLEINSINQETLTKLPKVTPALARKITKYKQILGGYHQIEQLLEVYDLDQSIYDEIIPYLTCDPIIEYLDINADDIEKLNRHPYIGYKKAKVIKRYRQQHGAFESVDQVKKVGVWNAEQFALLLPYLLVQD